MTDACPVLLMESKVSCVYLVLARSLVGTTGVGSYFFRSGLGARRRRHRRLSSPSGRPEEASAAAVKVTPEHRQRPTQARRPRVPAGTALRPAADVAPGGVGRGLARSAAHDVCDPGYMSRTDRMFRTDEFDR